MRSSLLSLGVLSTISVLENHGIQRGSSTWQPLLFGARSPRTGKLWGVRSREAIHATCVTMHLLGEGLSLLMAGKRNGCGTHQGQGGWGAAGGQLFTPRFISWDLLFRLAPLTPWGWRGIPPTYSSPAEEGMRLLSLAWKLHRFETISPPAGFSMERSVEDITIYSAQYVYTAWHPLAFQANVLPVWRGEALHLGVPEMPCPLSWGGAKLCRGSTHLPLSVCFFHLFLDEDTCPPAVEPIVRFKVKGSFQHK